jgi:hypothetical protein
MRHKAQAQTDARFNPKFETEVSKLAYCAPRRNGEQVQDGIDADFFLFGWPRRRVPNLKYLRTTPSEARDRVQSKLTSFKWQLRVGLASSSIQRLLVQFSRKIKLFLSELKLLLPHRGASSSKQTA